MTVERAATLGILVTILGMGLFDHDLWAPDEPRAAEIGREFLEPGASWIVPTLNAQPFMEKPPLVYWTIAACLKVLGVHDGAARLPAALFGAGTLAWVWALARRIYGGGAGTAACLILASSAGFLVVTHHVESDAGLLFFVTGASYFLWRAKTGRSGWYGAAAAAALGAFFSKGFIGLALPGLGFLAWVAWTRSPRELLRSRPWIWIPLVALPIGLWLWALAPPLARTFWVEHHLHRLVPSGGDQDRGHLKEPWYYLLQLPAWFLPWSLALVPVSRWVWARRREEAERFLLSFLLPAFLLWSAAGTKRAIYLLPLFPPLAILVGGWLSASRWRAWLLPSVATLVVGLGTAWGLLAPGIDRERSFKPVCRELSRRIGPRTKLYGYDPDETAQAVVPFYTGRTFLAVGTEAGLEALAREAAGEVVVVTVDVGAQHWHSDQVRRRFPQAWIETPGDRGRRMQVFSNVPSPGGEARPDAPARHD